MIAASSGIFAISWAGLIGGETLAERGIAPPVVAMWTPNAIFLLLGVWLASRMGREAANHAGRGLGQPALERGAPGSLGALGALRVLSGPS